MGACLLLLALNKRVRILLLSTHRFKDLLDLHGSGKTFQIKVLDLGSYSATMPLRIF